MATAAGWFNDPYGRYQQRYWDGQAWTEHVSTNGNQSIDPLGQTPVVPFAIPATAFTTPDETAPIDATAPPHHTTPRHSGQPRKFLDSLGPDARERPAPRLSLAFAGGGGALLAIGIVAAIVGDDGSRASAFGAAAVVLGAALAVRLLVKGQPDLLAAAVGAGVIGLFVLGVAIADDVDSSWFPAIVGVLFLAAWVLPGFRGRPIMLGIGTLLMISALAIATDSGDDDGVFGDVQYSDAIGSQGVVFLFAAAALFGLVWWLDREGYHGVATSLVVAALISALVGVTQTISNDVTSAGSWILVFAVGLLVCFVGSHGDRRATTWWGALLAISGVVGFMAAVMTPDSIGSTAGMFVISGALLIAGPAVVRAVRASREANGSSGPSAQPDAGSLPPPTF